MLNRLIGFFILVASFAVAWMMMEFNLFTETPVVLEAPGIVYKIRPGSSLAPVARDLQKKGVISSALLFRLLARRHNLANTIKAGEFRLKQGMVPLELLNLFVSGKVIQHSLTLVEGWSFKQVMAAIRANPILKQTLEGLDDKLIMERLGYADQHPEGRFLADTYHFPAGTTDIAFLKRAYLALSKVLDNEWLKREKGLPFKRPYEALILASIVEKETGKASERPTIAGVFVRRLKKGMKMQTDPTVIYGMGDRYKGNIRRRDLREDTPYNTYVHKGLTPTPISMPGLDSITAVLHPAKGKALYFVAKGDGTGSHYFSATLREHNNAVRKYQLKR